MIHFERGRLRIQSSRHELSLLDRAADESFDERFVTQVSGGSRLDGASIAEDRHSVSDGVDFFEPVCDVDARAGLPLQLLQLAEKTFRFDFVESRGRFIKNEYTRVARKGACDLDELASAER